MSKAPAWALEGADELQQHRINRDWPAYQKQARSKSLSDLDIPRVEGPNMDAVARLERFAAKRRAEIGEERWAELSAIYEGDGL